MPRSKLRPHPHCSAHRIPLVAQIRRTELITRKLYEYAAEGSIVVADDVCWRLVSGECLGNLACQPLRRRMPGHRKPQQLPPSVAENKKCEELLKGNRRNYKQINRRDPVSVVVQEGLPCLRGATSPRYHVLRDCRLGDVEAELQKLAVDMRRTPKRVFEAHSSDKVAHLLVDLRSATERAGFPSPKCSEAFAMPTHNRLRP